MFFAEGVSVDGGEFVVDDKQPLLDAFNGLLQFFKAASQRR